MLETPIGWVLLFLIGTFTGTLAGLLGIGGGLLMVPALTLFGVPLVKATATSLVGVFLSSASGSLQNLRTGTLNWQTSVVLALFGILTAQLGAWLGDRIPDSLLSICFAALQILTIYLMDLKQRLNHKNHHPSLPLPLKPSSLLPHPSSLIPPPSSLLPTASIGLLAGLLSGLFGVGGGLVMVPLQMLFLGESIKDAIRTSLGAIVAIAISGLIQHSLNNNVLWIPGLCLGAGGIFGAQFGTRLLPRLSDRAINLMFRAFLMLLAIYMVARAVL